MQPPQGWLSSPRRVCGVLSPGQPTPSPPCVTPTVPGALGKHGVDWGQLPVTWGPSAGPEEGAEEWEALTERGGTAKGSGTIWRLKPGQQGQTPREGCRGGSALGTWAWKVLEGNSREAGAVPSPRAGQRLAEACPGGDGLVGTDPSPEPFGTSGWEGTRAEGCDRDSGRGAPGLPCLPCPLLPITAPGPHPSCNLNSNLNHYPCARNRAAITGDETGEGALLTSSQGESWSKRAMAGRGSAESSRSQSRIPVPLGSA